MRWLDRLWQRFDALCTSHGVYKVEVIGDCYLAVCGMHPPRRDHAQAALRFALDLHAAATGVAVEGEDGLSIRVGVHSGPVSSGVVGHLRQRWCIFGDTVNTASRSALPTLFISLIL
jgi:class 3 adenylate cyclase